MKKKWRLTSDSVHYKHNKFLNLEDTPMGPPEGFSMRKILRAYRQRPATVTPAQPIPTVSTDLTTLHSATPVVVWFGHSSYLIHCKGTTILVDPVFSGHASPVGGMIKAFPGANVYLPADMPVIDAMIITHNHYDHLDKKTIGRLRGKTKAFYTALGVGKDIAGCCGGDATPITEMDWGETVQVLPGITLSATPARHFSGRGLVRGKSLWNSFVLQIHGYTVFIGGDSGYGAHFKSIGDQYGPIDLAILECGQYNTLWPYIHMMPEQTVQAAIDLQAKALLPVHWGKFSLAYHPWNEPIQRVTAEAARLGMPIATPRIGEPVVVGEPYPKDAWWNV